MSVAHLSSLKPKCSQSITPTRSCFWRAHKVRVERNILCAQAGTLLDTRLCSKGEALPMERLLCLRGS